MKIGCCLNMHSTLPDGIGWEWVETTIRVGYDYIELPLAQLMELDKSTFYRFAQKVTNLDIPCEACNNFLPPNLKIIGNTDKTTVMGYVNQALERAAILGAQIVVFGSGASRNVPNDVTMDLAIKQLVDFLVSLIDLLERFGIVLVIEPLRIQESNIINNLNDAARIMNMVNNSHIKLLSDNFHMAFAGETAEVLSRWSKDIKHAHFCRVKGRIIPTGNLTTDEVNYISHLNINVGCPRISIEAFSNNFENDSKEAIALIKNRLKLIKR